jgi:hypothetical protein
MSKLATLQREITTLQQRLEPHKGSGDCPVIYLPDNGRDATRDRLAPSHTLHYGQVIIYGAEARA